MTNQELKIKATNYGLFDSSDNPTIPSLRLFYAYFEKLACDKSINQIDFTKVKNWIETNLKDSILKIHIGERILSYKTKPHSADIFYVLKNEMIINVDMIGNYCILLYNHEDRAKADEYADAIVKLKKRKKKAEACFSVIVKNGNNENLHRLKNINPKLNLEKNYNDDILPVHQNILKKLKTKDGSGLILLYGEPGTGKSTYIRHLIHCLKDRNIIFLSSVMVNGYKVHELTALLLDNPSSILIIEEAEDLLVEREDNYNSGIAMLLNITDGLLGKSLNVKVICTFNTHISKIDKALLRKGRLIAAYDFKPLSIEKSKALLAEKGITDYKVTEPMTLAELFNISEKGFTFELNERKPIGFMSQVA